MLKDCLRKCRNMLAEGNIPSPDYEAMCLVQHVTGYDRARQIAHANDELDAQQEALLYSLTERRLTHYPLQYLLGSWSFCGFELAVGEGVLIPRDDTEVAVNLCLEYLNNKKDARAIDLCSGSGAIAIAVAKLGGASVEAVERSEKAFYFLEKNINSNQAAVTAIMGDIFACHTDFTDGKYDLIVSNPPYIIRDEIKTLQTEVQHEPAMALDGGEDGYDFYKAIIAHWRQKLKKGGALVFELGEGQAEDVALLMKDSGFVQIRTALDFGGVKRAIIGILS